MSGNIFGRQPDNGEPPRPEDQLGISYEYIGGPMDGETERILLPFGLASSTIFRRGYRYEMDGRKLRCAGRHPVR